MHVTFPKTKTPRLLHEKRGVFTPILTKKQKKWRAEVSLWDQVLKNSRHLSYQGAGTSRREARPGGRGAQVNRRVVGMLWWLLR